MENLQFVRWAVSYGRKLAQGKPGRTCGDLLYLGGNCCGQPLRPGDSGCLYCGVLRGRHGNGHRQRQDLSGKGRGLLFSSARGQGDPYCGCPGAPAGLLVRCGRTGSCPISEGGGDHLGKSLCSGKCVRRGSGLDGTDGGKPGQPGPPVCTAF